MTDEAALWSGDETRRGIRSPTLRRGRGWRRNVEQRAEERGRRRATFGSLRSSVSLPLSRPTHIVDRVRKAMPLALTPEDDPRKEELKQLQTQLEAINKLAHKQVRRILWSGLGFLITQVGFFFRLTFWEFSWDVMEPITFFTTTTGLVVGYAYFLITSRDPTYRDFMERLFQSRQRKLIQRQNFNLERYLELQRCCKDPFEKMCGTNHSSNADIAHLHELSVHK